MKRRTKRKGTLRVGQSKITFRKVGGKRRKVRVTRMARNKYRVRVVGKRKKRSGRRKTRRR